MVDLAGFDIGDAVLRGWRSTTFRATRLSDAKQVLLRCPASPHVGGDTWPEYHYARGLGVEVEHPCVGRVIDLESSAGLPVLVFEDTGVESLASAFGGATPAGLEKGLEIASQLAAGLRALHDAGLTQHDLSPSNVAYDPATGKVLLLGYGIASRAFALLEAASVRPEVLPYLAPETSGWSRRPLDDRVDLFSLGATVYWLLSGREPIAQSSAPPLQNHLALMPPALAEVHSDIPVVVSDLVASLVERAPESRPQSVVGVVADIDTACWKLAQTGTIDSFTLGQHDQQRQLHVPHRLFGRRAEAEELLQCLQKARDGRASLVLVTGPAGIGKSTLVRELRAPTLRMGGTFAEGKFDQLAGHPYSAFLQSIGETCHGLLTQSAEALDGLAVEIQSALGEVGALLTQVVPSLERIVGEQPTLRPAGPSELRNRFHQLCLRVFKVFASSNAPLVLFLDDLQWAEDGPVALMRALLSDPEVANLMVVCAYRDGEVTESHPLPAAAESLQAVGAAVVRIPLGPLSNSAVTDLVVDALGRRGRRTETLAGAVHEATEGNPLSVHRRLRLLVDEGILAHETEAGGWTWTLDVPIHRASGGAAHGLLTQRLSLLPAATRDALAAGACFGARFDASALAQLSKTPLSRVLDALLPAIRGDLLYPCIRATVSSSDAPAHCFVFAHDEVQSAAYGLTPQTERDALHGRIGRLLFESAGREPGEEALHGMARQLERGQLSVLGRDDGRALAEALAKAGQAALRTGAFESAATYLRGAEQLLGAERWESDYSLALELARDVAIAAWLSGDLEGARTLLQDGKERATSPADQIELAVAHAELAGLTGEYVEALDVGFAGLALLGQLVPKTPEEWEAATQALGAELQARLQGADPADLLAAAPAGDPSIRDQLRVIASLANPAYTQPHVFPWLAMHSVWLTVEHGPTEHSNLGFVWYGLILCGAGQYALGDTFARAALAACERENPPGLPTLLHPYGVFVQHWAMPYEAVVSGLSRAVSLAFEYGNHISASWAAMTLPWTRLVAGDAISGVSFESRSQMDANLQVFRNPDAGHMNAWTLYQALRLAGDELALEELADRGYAPSDLEPKLSHFVGYLAANHVTSLVVCCHMQEWDEALQHATAARAMAAAMGGSVWVTELELYHSLALLAAPDGSPDDLRDRLVASIDLIAAWADACPENHSWKHHLLIAELAVLDGEDEPAISAFDRAIEAAEQHGRIHGRAMACLRAAGHRQRMGRERSALGLLVEAVDDLRRWGAEAAAKTIYSQHTLLDRVFASTQPKRSTGPHTRVELEQGALERSLAEGDLIDAIDPGVCEVDASGRILFANAAASRLTGWLQHELITQPLTRLLDVADWNPDDLERAGPVSHVEMELFVRRGDRLPVDVSIRPVRSSSGTVSGAVVSFSDISQRRELEQQLRHAQKMQAMGEFAGGVAHDFNNLLTPISGYISLARSMIGSEHRAETCLADAAQAADRAAELVKQMLAFGRHADIFMRPTDLHPLLHEVEKFARRALGREIEIRLSAPTDLDWVTGNAGLLHQVLMNLCLNARDALAGLRERTPLIELRADNVRLDSLPPAAPSQCTPGRFVRIEVSDNGIGMDRETVQRVFEPFFTTKVKGRGAGLGLAVVYGIMERHGGWIDCVSEPSQGTTFRCWLAGRDPEPESVQSSATPGPVPVVEGARILVVDDEPLVRELAKAVLEGEGHEVLLAGDGRAAVEAYRDADPGFALVLLDLSMPVMNGEEALARILAVDSDAKVVLWSGYAREGGSRSAQELGAKAFVAKPVKPEALAQLIDSVLIQE